VRIAYPSEDEEFQIVRQTTAGAIQTVREVLTRDELLSLQRTVRAMPVADHVIRYALSVARLTRRGEGEIPEFICQYVSWGAGPRASQYLILGAKAHAALEGREYAGVDDVRAVAAPVLRHRIITNFNAEADGVNSDEIVRRLIELVPVEGTGSRARELSKLFRTA
jgi:MoxR-like ATPase